MDKMCDINLNEETSEDNGELRRSLTSLDGWDFADNHEEPSEPPERPDRPEEDVLKVEEIKKDDEDEIVEVVDERVEPVARVDRVDRIERIERVERAISPLPIERSNFSPTESNISRASSVRETDQLSSYSLPGATLSFHQQHYSHYHHQPSSNYGPGYYGGPPPPQHGVPMGGPGYHPNHYQHYGNQPPPSQNPNFYQPIPQYHSNYSGYGAPSPGPGMFHSGYYPPMQGYEQNRQRPYMNDPYSRQPPQRFDPNTTSSSSFDRSFGPSNYPNPSMPLPSLNMAGGGYPPAAVPPAYPSALSGNPANNLPPEFFEWYKRYVRWYSTTVAGSEAGGRRQRLTPPLYPVRHSRVTFGPLNQLVVAYGQNIVIHHLQPTLIDAESKISISTWPGPLIIGQTDKSDVMEFVKAQDGQHQTIGEAIEVSIYDRQKKQIWQILKMLVQLNGNISGSDIAELLLYHNEAEFTSDENNEVNQYRRLLTLGQRKNALEFATKNNLWDHFWTLTCLTLSRETFSYSNPPTAMMEAASKFINTTLNSQDALYILYRCLLNKLRTYYNKNIAKPLPISNLHHFTILLANECEINSVVPAASSELLNFIIALRNNDSQHLISISPVASYDIDSKRGGKLDYSEELVFINEIFEYARNCDELIIDFIPYKVLFTCKLFDYGFISQAKKYCERIREAVNHYTNESPGLINYANVNWDLVTKIIDDIESRITGTLIESASESYVASSDAVAGDDEPSISEVSVDQLVEGVGGMSVGIDEETAGSVVSSPHKSQTSSVIDDQPPVYPRPDSSRFQRPEPVSFISRPEPFNILSTQSSLPQAPTPVELPTPTSMRPPSPPSAPTPINTFTPISFSDNFTGPGQQQSQQFQQLHQQQQQSQQPPPPAPTPSQQNFNQSTNQFNSQRQNQTWRPRQRTNSTMSSVAGDVATSTPPQTPRGTEPSPWVTQVPPAQSFVPFSQPSQPFQSQPQVPFQNQQQQFQPQQPIPAPPPPPQQQQEFLESGQSQPMSYISVQPPSYDLNRYEESEPGHQSYRSLNQYNFNSTTTNGLAAPSISTPIVSPIASPSTDYSQMRSNSSFDTTTTQQVNPRESEDKKSDDKDRNTDGDTLDSKQTAKQKGVFDFLFSKLPSLPKRAVLPDDKDPSIIWDDKLQKWVNKDEKDDPSAQNVPSGPPKIPMFNQSMGSFGPSQPSPPQQQQLPAQIPSSDFSNFQNSGPQNPGMNPMIPPIQQQTNPNIGSSLSYGDSGFPSMDPTKMSFVKSKQKRWVDINTAKR